MKTKKLLKAALKTLVRLNEQEYQLINGNQQTEVRYLLKLLKGSKKYRIIKEAMFNVYGNTQKTCHIDDIKNVFGQDFKVSASVENILAQNGWLIEKL